jgi:hypothetical protein
MKKQILILWTILFMAHFAAAQPQWKFHIAFEDATGAKDTIWCIWDTAATDGSLTSVDTAFGEAGVTFDYSVFNVWIYNNVPFPFTDSTKTSAIPFNGTFSLEIRAFNYQYPLTISWDSSLFHAPGLPLPVGYVNRAWMGNNYFFIVNNDPPAQAFNMLWDNSVIAPWFFWGTQSQFPLGVLIMRDPTIGINENNTLKKRLTLFPNPCKEYLNIITDLIFETYYLLGNDGKVIKKEALISDQNGCYNIPVTQIESGFYHLILTNTKNQSYHEKIIISR